MEKSKFCVLIKHCFPMGKILFKQINGLLSVIRILLLRKQRLRVDMLTLNAVVRIQIMVNGQVNEIQQLPRKTPKNSANSFWPIVNWSCVRYQRSWRYQKTVYLPFFMNICQWESCVQSGCYAYSESIKNNNRYMIQSVVYNCFNAIKTVFA